MKNTLNSADALTPLRTESNEFVSRVISRLTPPATPSTSPECPNENTVTGQLEILSNRLHCLERAILMMRESLDPIMVPTGDLPVAPGDKSPPRCRAVESLAVCNRRVEYLTAFLTETNIALRV